MELNSTWLIQLQRAKFDEAALWGNTFASTQLAIATTALLSLFVNDHSLLYFLAALTIALTALALLFKAKRNSCRSVAERARRATLLADGMGFSIPNETLMDLWRDQGIDDKIVQHHDAKDYYATPLPPGNGRLCQILCQSAFWTSYLQRKSAAIAWLLFSTSVALALMLLVAAVPYSGHETVVMIGRVVFAIATYVLAQGLFELATGYQEAATGTDRILSRLTTAEARGCPELELMHILMDYNALVEQAPLVFPGIYSRYRKSLNDQWEKRYSNTGNLEVIERDPLAPPTDSAAA